MNYQDPYESPTLVLDGTYSGACLYLGGAEDVGFPGFDGYSIAVHENKDDIVDGWDDYWLPIMVGGGDENPERFRASKDMLDAVRHVMRHHLLRGDDVLVHCGAGIERAPLAVAWYFKHYHHMTMNAAYDYIEERRPQIKRRTHWLDFGKSD